MASGGGGVIFVGRLLTRDEKRDRGLMQDGVWWWECDFCGETADQVGKKGWRAQQLDEIKRETGGWALSFLIRTSSRW